MPFDAARQIVVDAIAGRAFPCAVVEVGTSERVVWREAFGRLTYDTSAPAATQETVFDLASLTKVIATTSLMMGLVEERLVHLEHPIGRWVRAWHGSDRAGATLEHALAHATGLPDWLPLFREHRGRSDFAAAIAATPLEYTPGTKSVYSDLGFILLGLVIEDVAAAPLDRLFDAMRGRMQLGEIGYSPPADWRRRAAPTEYDPWRRRTLVGEVHDENAFALDGVAAHAGLFGTVAAVGRFAQQILGARQGLQPAAWAVTPQTVRLFTTRRDIPGSSRALGWDTMRRTSSCGAEMSPSAFGHTGFTGTSLWVDPVLGLYAVLLSNRVHPSRENGRIAAVRPAFHDAVVGEFRATDDSGSRRG
jgi:serine-type D-Ala-D-Ala carboxypeptidase